jgi:hypothetical protein
MYIHSMHCVIQNALEDLRIFQSVVISHLYKRNETYEILFINLL